MKVQDVMTSNPACCTPDTTLQRVAELMVENDCGEIPVVEDFAGMMPIGVITDRDIVCRTVAKDVNPLGLTVGECMTSPCVTVMPDMPIEQCIRALEDNQIRRVVVVDAGGACTGIVALADIALHSAKRAVGEIVKEISEPTASASAAGR